MSAWTLVAIVSIAAALGAYLGVAASLHSLKRFVDSRLVDPEADAASVRREVSELTAPSRTDRPEYKIYDAITTEALAEYRRITRQASAPRRAIHTAFARMKRAFRDWRARRA